MKRRIRIYIDLKIGDVIEEECTVQTLKLPRI